MGQKLERPSERLEQPSEKDEESFENADWSEQTGETEEMEQDASRDQDSSSVGGNAQLSGGNPAIGQVGELTLTPARTDPQTGQPIRSVGQQEGTLNTRGEWVGGDSKSHSIAQTVEESKTVLRLKQTKQTPNSKRGSESKAVVCAGTAAMEEQGNGKRSEVGQRKVRPDAQTGSPTVSCDTTNEEDFVVLEEDETLMSSVCENNIVSGDGTHADNLQSSQERRVEEDSCDGRLQQPSGNVPREKKFEETRGTKSVPTDRVEAHGKTLTTASFERERGQRLAEVTGSRCQLKGVSYVAATHTETTGKAERAQTMNEQEDMVDEAVRLTREREVQSNREPCSEKMNPSIKESDIQDKESHNSGVTAEKNSAGMKQCDPGKVAGAVSKKAKKEDGQVFQKAADAPSQKPPCSEMQLLQDNLLISLEQCDLIPCPPLLENGGNDGKRQVASLKRESELVCFSAVITPPPVTHWLPKGETSLAIQLGTSMVHSQTQQDATPVPCDSKDSSLAKEKPKVKGPPPPVPKKPKNPFIKLKTAQLMSSDVQRRGKDHLRSEERVKRRHTFDFNKNIPWIAPTNQDMCLLWDERGTYTVPANRRPLSVDLSPWEHDPLRRLDDQYGDMIDYDYCARMAKLSPEEDVQNLDMLQRREFLERRARFKGSPPSVAKKPPKPFASTETVHIPEVIPDNETQRPKPAGRREIHHELQFERTPPHVSSYADVTDYSSRRDAESSSEVGSYKPVAEIVKETNQMQRHQARLKTEGAKVPVRVVEQSPSVRVSQMKNAFDVPKKSKERPAEFQSSPKKGKNLVSVFFSNSDCHLRVFK